ncbi:hypothetical protein HYFRA_00008130 [Hymenoscyphus fraxineus]|uniref:chitinase n=1 Tax=Hymenoscyphus fraxineus TaxID=746836 RepID=A0A9N9Q053_9HELO|nr:hypothetical protein HYFRA_00008130 [Hymenoscyphus fraxineus]
MFVCRLRSLFITVLLAMLRVANAVFEKGASGDVAIYWGQNSAGEESSQGALGEYCRDPRFTIVMIAFLVDLGDLEKGLNLASSTGDPLEQEIITCQNSYKKTVLLSLGGEITTQAFNSTPNAIETAQRVWYAFGPHAASNPDSPRPFGDVSVDGFDFDYESSGEAQQPMPFLADFAKELRRLMDEPPTAGTLAKRYYLTAAPQCVFPDKKNVEMLDGVFFDALFVQYYNNPRCGTENYLSNDTTTREKFNIGVWDAWARSTSLNRDVRIFLGVPASPTAVAGAGGYVDAERLGPVIERCRTFGSFGGVMVWDMSQAWANGGFLDGVARALGRGGKGSGNGSVNGFVFPMTGMNSSLSVGAFRATGVSEGGFSANSSAVDRSTDLSTGVATGGLSESSSTVDTATGLSAGTSTEGSFSASTSLDTSTVLSTDTASSTDTTAALTYSGSTSSSSSLAGIAPYSGTPLNSSILTRIADLSSVTSLNSPSSINAAILQGNSLPVYSDLSMDVTVEGLSHAVSSTQSTTATTFSESEIDPSTQEPSFLSTSSADPGAFSDLSRSTTFLPQTLTSNEASSSGKSTTRFSRTTTITVFANTPTITITIPAQISSLDTLVTSIRPLPSTQQPNIQSPFGSSPNTEVSTSIPPNQSPPSPSSFQTLEPEPNPQQTPQPSISLTFPDLSVPTDVNTGESQELTQTEQPTCPLLETSTVTMSATLIVAQPTTFTEMKTVTVERTRMVAVPVSTGRWSLVGERV